MKKYSILVLTLILSLSVAHATIWRVNNNPLINADFSSIQAAHDAATSGDTIYVEASLISHNDAITISKQLVIIGNGYYLDSNYPENLNSQFFARVTGSITLNSGSEGSNLVGIHVSNQVLVNVPNITVFRVLFDANGRIDINSDNTVIRSCSLHAVFGNNPSNILFENNIFKANFTIGPTYESTLIVNNIFVSNATITNQTLSNNINLGAATLTNCSSSNNIDARIGQQVFGTTDGNFGNVDPSTIFIGGSSPDGQYQLKSGSPALGAAADGGDCGIFGGSAPYIISGIPPIPWIHKLNSSGIGSSITPLQITISVDSRN